MLTNNKPVILIPTVKKDEAKEFYESALGLEFKSDDGFALVFDAGGIMFRVTPVQAFTPHEFSVLGWEVDDADALAQMQAHLEANGVVPVAGSADDAAIRGVELFHGFEGHKGLRQEFFCGAHSTLARLLPPAGLREKNAWRNHLHLGL